MFRLRPSSERGHFDFGWLQTRHSFSFGEYSDREHMGFRSLRVINEDVVAPGRGFDEHDHADMEIVTVVISGALAHRDSLGNGTTITPGEVQRMTAGLGISHSEYNASATEPVHLLQIWLRPDRKGHPPGYEQKAFDFRNGLIRVASGSGQEGAIYIHQDVELFRAQLTANQSQYYPLALARHGWVQVVAGQLQIGDQTLNPGDGLAISAVRGIYFSAGVRGPVSCSLIWLRVF